MPGPQDLVQLISGAKRLLHCLLPPASCLLVVIAPSAPARPDTR